MQHPSGPEQIHGLLSGMNPAEGFPIPALSNSRDLTTAFAAAPGAESPLGCAGRTGRRR